MGLDMLEVLGRFNEQYHHSLRVRIGMSSGAAVAGVIGKSKFFYDLWGDAVNTSSRMESYGVPGRIQATRRHLGAAFLLERRGAIDVKGKGVMSTWFLNGRNGQVCAVAQDAAQAG
jgi:class 3 adenylate cyclase